MSMKKMKKKSKIVLLAALGICIFSFIPAVLGVTNKRPISAFTETNDITCVLGWASFETGIGVFPHGFLWDPETISDCDPEGSVLVKDLKDGRISYKVSLHVKDALMWVLNISDYTIIFVGLMDYYFSTILIVYGDVSDPVPNLIDVWYGEGESPYVHITGSGTGEFIEEWPGYTPGDTAKVKLNQVAIAKPPDHPQIDPEYDPVYIWPAELTFFH
jgi:hypothetical protein